MKGNIQFYTPIFGKLTKVQKQFEIFLPQFHVDFRKGT
jgi:hypothetical protein